MKSLESDPLGTNDCRDSAGLKMRGCLQSVGMLRLRKNLALVRIVSHLYQENSRNSLSAHRKPRKLYCTKAHAGCAHEQRLKASECLMTACLKPPHAMQGMFHPDSPPASA